VARIKGLTDDEKAELEGVVEFPDELPEADTREPESVFSGKEVGQVEWEWFIGRSFELTGVGSENVKLKDSWRDDDANRFSFILDGTCYTAVEDPSDGYRSSLSYIAVTKGTTIANRFAPVKVTARKAKGDTQDVVELVDDATGNVVIQFGTTNTDDYYPGFVGNFDPKAMVINESPEQRKIRLDAERAKFEQERMDAQRAEVLTENGWGSW
jgi:hypothetical protein